MSQSLSTPNTSPTPNSPGQWIVTKFGPPSVLKWQSFDPLLSLPADHVLVRIIVGGIAGVDNIQRAGGYPDPKAASPGFSPGYDLVGEIISLGSSVPQESKLAVGDRVAALCRFGAHATHITMPYNAVLKLNKDDDAIKVTALTLNYMTSWGMLKHIDVDLPPGSSILIGSASGGLGTGIAQLVAAFKLDIKMIGTTSPAKFDYLRSLGVRPIDRNAPDLVDQVRALTGGEGVDVAYDAVCSEDSIRKSLASTKSETGRVICVGVMGEIAADGSGMSKNVHEVIAERLQSPRVTFWGLDTDFPIKEAGRKEFYDIVEKVRTGELDPVIAGYLRLEDAVKAHEMIVDGGKIMGKLVFLVDKEIAAEHGI